MIPHIHFPNQYLLTSSLMRVSDHFESPQLAGKIFSLEECMDSYARHKGECTYFPYRYDGGEIHARNRKRANFTYFIDWTGFNIPSRAFEPFFEGKFDPLWNKERAVIETLRHLPQPFYFIGTFEGSEADVLWHETIHGLYAGHPGYAAAVEATVAPHMADGTLAEFHGLLLARGYTNEVLVDETNAYATTGWLSGMTADHEARLAPLRAQLWTLFRKNFGIDLSNAAEHPLLLQYVTSIPYAEIERRLAAMRP